MTEPAAPSDVMLATGAHVKTGPLQPPRDHAPTRADRRPKRRLAEPAELTVSLADLSPRERDILAAYPRLGRYALIRAELHMGQQTIKNHVSSIIRKLGVATLGQAAVLWDREQR